MPPKSRVVDNPAHLHRLNETLVRLQHTVNSRLQNSGDETIAKRAAHLTDRLAVLQHKMRAAFGKDNPELPENLRPVMKQLADVDADDAPPEFLCPISQALMVDPVSTADGNTYDRPSILEWFATFTDGRPVTSPLTNLPLVNRELVPLPALRKQVQTFMHSKLKKTAPEVVPDTPEVVEKCSGPIWSSSVVPASELGSRELNLLRVHDGPVTPLLPARAARPMIAPAAAPLRGLSSRPSRIRSIAAVELERIRTAGVPPGAIPARPRDRTLYSFVSAGPVAPRRTSSTSAKQRL